MVIVVDRVVAVIEVSNVCFYEREWLSIQISKGYDMKSDIITNPGWSSGVAISQCRICLLDIFANREIEGTMIRVIRENSAMMTFPFFRYRETSGGDSGESFGLSLIVLYYISTRFSVCVHCFWLSELLIHLLCPIALLCECNIRRMRWWQ